MELEDVIKVHSIGYGLEDVKVEFKHDLKMDVSGVQIEGKEKGNGGTAFFSGEVFICAEVTRGASRGQGAHTRGKQIDEDQEKRQKVIT